MKNKAVERLDKFTAELSKLTLKHGVVLGEVGRVEVLRDEYRDAMGDDDRYHAFPQLYRGTSGEWELVPEETTVIWGPDIDTGEDADNGEDEG